MLQQDNGEGNTDGQNDGADQQGPTQSGGAAEGQGNGGHGNSHEQDALVVDGDLLAGLVVGVSQADQDDAQNQGNGGEQDGGGQHAHVGQDTGQNGTGGAADGQRHGQIAHGLGNVLLLIDQAHDDVGGGNVSALGEADTEAADQKDQHVGGEGDADTADQVNETCDDHNSLTAEDIAQLAADGGQQSNTQGDAQTDQTGESHAVQTLQDGGNKGHQSQTVAGNSNSQHDGAEGNQALLALAQLNESSRHKLRLLLLFLALAGIAYLLFFSHSVAQCA